MIYIETFPTKPPIQEPFLEAKEDACQEVDLENEAHGMPRGNDNEWLEVCKLFSTKKTWKHVSHDLM